MGPDALKGDFWLKLGLMLSFSSLWKNPESDQGPGCSSLLPKLSLSGLLLVTLLTHKQQLCFLPQGSAILSAPAS